MQTHGTCDQVYEPPIALREALQLQESYTFTCHKDLDAFMAKLATDSTKKGIALRFDYETDLFLLKSFDRAFWYKYMTQETILNAPLQNEHGECQCFFSDPRVTGTMVCIVLIVLHDRWQFENKRNFVLNRCFPDSSVLNNTRTDVKENYHSSFNTIEYT